jgi:hypothetical protein
MFERREFVKNVFKNNPLIKLEEVNELLIKEYNLRMDISRMGKIRREVLGDTGGYSSIKEWNDAKKGTHPPLPVQSEIDAMIKKMVLEIMTDFVDIEISFKVAGNVMHPTYKLTPKKLA